MRKKVKQIEYDRHARRRMKWRRISEKDIELVLEAPDKIEPTAQDRKNAYKRIGKRYLKITYKELKDKIVVITVVDKGGIKNEN